MRIGITFNLRGASEALASDAVGTARPAPDDAEEEYDAAETIEALKAELERLGHEVELLGDGERVLRRLLQGERPELVFNLAEGSGASRSREARLPALFELLGIPYTGSDPLTLAATLDKDCAKRLVRDAGVATPRWVLVEPGALSAAAQRALAELPLPLIVKPAYEGSSKGIRSKSLVRARAELEPLLAELGDGYRQPILVEEFIDGDELTVGLVGNAPPRVLGIMRVVPRDAGAPFVYSLEVKRDWKRLVSYETPARLAAADTEAVTQAALAAWRALGCRDVSRIDFRLRAGVPYFLETNPLPGLSPEYSDLVLLARGIGMSYAELVEAIVATALRRLGAAPVTSGTCGR